MTFVEKAVIMNDGEVSRAVKRMAHEIVEANKGTQDLVLLGIQRRGVPLARMLRDSIAQFEQGGRQELADRERQEMAVLQAYLPQQLADDEVAAIVAEAVSASGAKSPSDMGKVMAIVKPQVQGRADMGLVSQRIKARLA